MDVDNVQKVVVNCKNGSVFGSQPYLAIRTTKGQYYHDNLYEKEFKKILKNARPEIDVDNEEELLSTKGFKFQGQIKLYNFMADNPEFMNLLNKIMSKD